MPDKKYVTLPGMDGSGKNTIFQLLKNHFPDAVFTREPGGTPEAEIIRDVLLNEEMTEKERIKTIEQVS
jgi:dTMP kinase